MAIIGAGIGGLSVAHYCTQQGILWDLYADSLENMQQSASRVATGVATLKGISQARAPLFALKIEGHREFFKILQSLSQYAMKTLHQPKLYHCGVVEPFVSCSAQEQQRNRTYGKAPYPASMQVIDQHLLENSLVYNAFYYPDDYTYDPRRVCQVWTHYLESAASGCHILQQKVEAEDIQTEHLAINIGNFRYSHVVVAAGCHLLSFLDDLGYRYTKQHADIIHGHSLRFSLQYPEYLMDISRVLDKKQEDTRWIFGLKRGSCGVRMWRVSEGWEALFGSVNHKQRIGADDQSMQHDSACRLMSGERYDMRSECSLSHKVQNYWLQQMENFALNPYVNHPLQIIQGKRLSLQEQRPVWGPLSLSKVCPGQNIWAIGGFHKSGYTLAPVLARRLVSCLKHSFGDIQRIKGAHAAWEIFQHHSI